MKKIFLAMVLSLPFATFSAQESISDTVDWNSSFAEVVSTILYQVIDSSPTLLPKDFSNLCVSSKFYSASRMAYKYCLVNLIYDLLIQELCDIDFNMIRTTEESKLSCIATKTKKMLLAHIAKYLSVEQSDSLNTQKKKNEIRSINLSMCANLKAQFNEKLIKNKIGKIIEAGSFRSIHDKVKRLLSQSLQDILLEIDNTVIETNQRCSLVGTLNKLKFDISDLSYNHPLNRNFLWKYFQDALSDNFLKIQKSYEISEDAKDDEINLMRVLTLVEDNYFRFVEIDHPLCHHMFAYLSYRLIHKRNLNEITFFIKFLSHTEPFLSFLLIGLIFDTLVQSNDIDLELEKTLLPVDLQNDENFLASMFHMAFTERVTNILVKHPKYRSLGQHSPESVEEALEKLKLLPANQLLELLTDYFHLEGENLDFAKKIIAYAEKYFREEPQAESLHFVLIIHE